MKSSTSTVEEQAAAILVEEGGVVVSFEGGTCRVRPLNMEELLSLQVARDVAAIASALLGALDGLTPEKLQSLVVTPTGLNGEAIMGLVAPVLEPVKRCLALCLDKPLASLPHWAAPGVFEAFFKANFSGPRQLPWVGLMTQAGALIGAARSGGGSQTPSASSSGAATAGGGSTPPSSSNSTSGPP